MPAGSTAHAVVVFTPRVALHNAGMKLYWRCIVPLLLVLAVCCCCGCGCYLLCGGQQRTAHDDYKSDYGTFEDADPKRQSASAW